MDRGRAPNGIGHLMILIRRDFESESWVDVSFKQVGYNLWHV